MKLTFNIRFETQMGQTLFVLGSLPQLGEWNENKALELSYLGDGSCEASVTISDKITAFSYYYFVKEAATGLMTYEDGLHRELDLQFATQSTSILCHDTWRLKSAPEDAVKNTGLFAKVVHVRADATPLPLLGSKKPKQLLQIQISAPELTKDETVYLSGSGSALGDWDLTKALKMAVSERGLWSLQLEQGLVDYPLAYKYGVKKKNESGPVVLEEGENRSLDLSRVSRKHIIHTDEALRVPTPTWRGAGVAVPVFSLRSDQSLGIGEFLDLKTLGDWAEKTELNIIQLLPINDTTNVKTWLDCYPYRPITVMALHPMYANVEAVGKLTPTEKKQYDKDRQLLNAKDVVDYEAVNDYKHRYFSILFQRDKEALLASESFLQFFRDNKHWLVNYAAFCLLRDRFGTAEFANWGDFSTYDPAQVALLVDPKSKDYDAVSYYYFLQYHLDKQLREAADYLRQKGIALKGDIPIGIGRESVEVWTSPAFFNLDANAGAPPDFFATEGQNWEFPPYDWDEMEKDMFSWWKLRFKKMEDYFDAYRIDHILGFFRIWQIPSHSVSGLLGQFNKALPYSAQDLEALGLWWDYERMCRPYITDAVLWDIFGDEAAYVKKTFLDEAASHSYRFQSFVDTQKKVEHYFDQKPKKADTLKDKLMTLLAEVLFVPDYDDASRFHPRISLHSTRSYADLDEGQKHVLNGLYNDYFFARNNGFWWHRCMRKLPTLVKYTDMLTCGEDLGMIPNCVFDVMARLKILSLEMPQLPKDSSLRFGNPDYAAYLSVVTTSTHDMSTFREWWEEDSSRAQDFYNNILGREGASPFFAEPYVCQDVINRLLRSPAMLAIFPIQDLLAIDGDLRAPVPAKERINEPSNNQHYWQWRLHLSLDKLVAADSYNVMLANMVREAGR